MAAVTYVAREREATDIPIDAVYQNGQFELLPDVQGRDYFDVKFRGDRLTVTAGKYVGLVPLNDRVFIRVEPKMPVSNMLAILASVSGDIVELKGLQREYALAQTTPAPILAAIASAFVSAMRAVETDGLLKRYAEHVESGAHLKGQVVFSDSVQFYWSRGTRHRAVSRFFDLSADLVENQLLRYACRLLLAQHSAAGGLDQSAKDLAHFEDFLSLAGVSLAPPNPPDLVAPAFDAGPRSYAKALQLARMVIAGKGIELRALGADVALSSFLVNMETLFERYVRKVLASRLAGTTVLDGNGEGAKPLFDDRREPPANPDVVVRRPSSEVLIGEVKYKAHESRDDLNQVLAYALSYRAPVIVLVLPAESHDERGLSDIGYIAGVRLCRYRFDLAADDLEIEESQFANTVDSLIGPIKAPTAAGVVA